MGKKKKKPVRRPTVVHNDESDEEVVLDADPQPPQGPPPELPKKKPKSSFLLFSGHNRDRIKPEIIARAPELYEERGPGVTVPDAPNVFTRSSSAARNDSPSMRAAT